MAFTATRQDRFPIGNKIAEIWELSFASVTSGETKTGLKQVDFAAFTNETTEAQGLVNKNSASASETEDDLGSVFISGVTSNDNGVLFVIGTP